MQTPAGLFSGYNAAEVLQFVIANEVRSLKDQGASGHAPRDSKGDHDWHIVRPYHPRQPRILITLDSLD